MPSDVTHSSMQATAIDTPAVRNIVYTDLLDCITKGVEDFKAKPSHPLFVGIIYPLAMIIAIGLTFNRNLLPIAFPVVSGFALLGPFVALGLYELSRRRERGEEISWQHAFKISVSPAFPEILKIGAILLSLFLLWIGAAAILYFLTIGGVELTSIGDFVNRLFLTQEGWVMIIVDNSMGFIFAVIALTISVVSLPMLVDRHVEAGVAVRASVAAVRANPVTMAVWADRGWQHAHRRAHGPGRSGGGHAGARPRHLASVSQGGGLAATLNLTGRTDLRVPWR